MSPGSIIYITPLHIVILLWWIWLSYLDSFICQDKYCLTCLTWGGWIGDLMFVGDGLPRWLTVTFTETAWAAHARCMMVGSWLTTLFTLLQRSFVVFQWRTIAQQAICVQALITFWGWTLMKHTFKHCIHFDGYQKYTF